MVLTLAVIFLERHDRTRGTCPQSTSSALTTSSSTASASRPTTTSRSPRKTSLPGTTPTSPRPSPCSAANRPAKWQLRERHGRSGDRAERARVLSNVSPIPLAQLEHVVGCLVVCLDPEWLIAVVLGWATCDDAVGQGVGHTLWYRDVRVGCGVRLPVESPPHAGLAQPAHQRAAASAAGRWPRSATPGQRWSSFQWPTLITSAEVTS